MNKKMKFEVSYMSFFLSVLTVLFIYLKLTDQIEWSWLWVFSPLWLVPAFLLTILGLILLIVYISNNKKKY